MRTVFGLVVLAVSTLAPLGASADGVAIDVSSASKSSDIDALLAPVHAELMKRGFTVGPALATAMNVKLSRDGGDLTTSEVVDAQRDVDDAYQWFIDGDYDRAFTRAKNAVTTYDRAPAKLAREPSLRDLRYKALIIASRSAEIRGHADDAFALMAEAIRSFPDRSINTAQFDPSVIALFRKVKQELAKQGGGTLEIKTDDPAATIFVDEQFAGSGTARLDKAPPGRYRIYVTKGQARGRVREMDLSPGASATLDVPSTLDAALHDDAGGVSLVTDADDAAQVQLAVRLGHALRVKSVVLLSVRNLNGRRAIVGYAIDVESQSKTFAAVQIDPVAPSPTVIGKLASLLAGDKDASAPELITVEPGASAPIVERPRSSNGRSRTPAWIVGGIGVVSLAVAGGFELSSRSTYDESAREPDDARQRTLYDSANTKYKVAQGLAVGGAACLVGAVILYVRGSGDDSHERVTIAPAIGSETVGFAAMGSF